MKKWITWILILIISFSLIGCGQKSDPTVSLPNNIEKITISRGPFLTFSYTDSAKIEKFVTYFTSLEFYPSNETPDKVAYVGSPWYITVTAGRKTIEMVHFCTFFQTPKEDWYAITYQQGEEFETIMRQTIPDELPQNTLFKEWLTD